METLRLEPDLQKPKILSPCSSGRRRSNASNSPEFEFWMVRNPSLPPHNLHSADELFVGGVLRPLHLIHPNSDDPPDPPNPEPPSTNSNPPTESEAGSGPEFTSALPDSSATVLTASKRWKDIFKKTDRKSSNCNNNEDKEKEKKRERKSGGGNGASSAELNINIWPFSRSRSAGNSGAKPKMVAGSAAATRKVSSAPCSRSNSAGESKSRKWPSSPSRGGVHLGRSSPVWQVRRAGSGGRSSEPMIRNVEKGLKKEGNEARRNKPTCANAAATGSTGGGGGGPKARVLSLNVPMCIGYRHHLSCRSDENGAVGVAAPGGGGGGQSTGGGSGDGGRGGNLFNLRSLFNKKVY